MGVAAAEALRLIVIDEDDAEDAVEGPGAASDLEAARESAVTGELTS